MTEIKKKLKILSRTQIGVSLTKEDREILETEEGDIVTISSPKTYEEKKA